MINKKALHEKSRLDKKKKQRRNLANLQSARAHINEHPQQRAVKRMFKIGRVKGFQGYVYKDKYKSLEAQVKAEWKELNKEIVKIMPEVATSNNDVKQQMVIHQEVFKNGYELGWHNAEEKYQKLLNEK